VGWASADFNGDRAVNTLDFNLLAANFGFVYSAADAAAAPALGTTIPEPTSLILLVTAIGLRSFRISRPARASRE
jgi:hypothetical protein